jgi:hypothetical protein
VDKLAIEDPDADIAYIAIYFDRWVEPDYGQWSLLSCGRSKEEITDRVNHWKGRGTTGIRVFKVEPID